MTFNILFLVKMVSRTCSRTYRTSSLIRCKVDVFMTIQLIQNFVGGTIIGLINCSYKIEYV